MPCFAGPQGSRLVVTLRVLLVIVYLAVAATSGVIIWEFVSAWGTHAELIAWAVSGLCCCIAIPLPLHDIMLHAVHYADPPLQKVRVDIYCSFTCTCPRAAWSHVYL